MTLIGKNVGDLKSKLDRQPRRSPFDHDVVKQCWVAVVLFSNLGERIHESVDRHVPIRAGGPGGGVLAGVGGEFGGGVCCARQNVGPIGSVGDEITGLCRGEGSGEGFVDAEVVAEAAAHGGRQDSGYRFARESELKISLVVKMYSATTTARVLWQDLCWLE